MHFRNAKHYIKPLSLDINTRYIKNLSKLINRAPNTQICNAREIDATLEYNSEVPAENILSNDFWSK
ncbi:hypothetical protein AYI69_g10860 [Smittium culicis]|uniref:Uncharacterized protein n=1 Tax=Smittium culicis TaxID=133412 RepID=A0A1R1X312_9FUNG|nr:hypothetical protein AYI69_g10860 [Smittium culicis]